MHEDTVHNNIKHQCYLHVNETDPEGDRHDELPGSEEPNDLDRLPIDNLHLVTHDWEGSGHSEFLGSGSVEKIPDWKEKV